jgi:hypothetical protein
LKKCHDYEVVPLQAECGDANNPFVNFLKNKTGNGSQSASVFRVLFLILLRPLTLARPTVFFCQILANLKNNS